MPRLTSPPQVARGKLEEAQASLARIHGPHHDSGAEVGHQLLSKVHPPVPQVVVIRDNLAALRASRSRKSDYVSDSFHVCMLTLWQVRSLREHPEIYKPFLIIVTLRWIHPTSPNLRSPPVQSCPAVQWSLRDPSLRGQDLRQGLPGPRLGWRGHHQQHSSDGRVLQLPGAPQDLLDGVPLRHGDRGLQAALKPPPC